jgi:Tol biopolymer transport system component
MMHLSRLVVAQVARQGVAPSHRAHFRAVATALLALLVCVGIAGCGSHSATSGPPPTPTPTPAPSVAAISPAGTPTGATAFTMNVRGANFVPGSTVNWNGNSRTTTFVNSTRLQALILAADVAAPGKATVTVANPAPGGGTSNGATFTTSAQQIVFQSTGALDGTDAANTNNVQNIWVMNPDGSSPTALTKLTAVAAPFSRLPAFSMDGSKIAYDSQRVLDGSNAGLPSSAFNIWVANADGSNQAPLTKLLTGGTNSFDAVWSPDGTKIAFISSRALDGSDLFNMPSITTNVWVMNADGSNQTPLTRLTADQAGVMSPLRWSPDSSKLVFGSSQALNGSDAANLNHTANIWVMNADGTGLAPLTKLTAFIANSISPAWSPDGTKIVFASTRALDGSDALNTNNTQNIWVVNADGTGQTPLTKLTASNSASFSPAWSPSGTQIAFSSQRALDGSNAANTNATQNIWVMNADGSGPTALTKLTTASVLTDIPVWTPGGTKILFTSSRALNGTDAANTNGSRNIWLMNADGSNLTPLTKLTAANANSILPESP